jgi:hypothetical protein
VHLDEVLPDGLGLHSLHLVRHFLHGDLEVDRVDGRAEQLALAQTGADGGHHYRVVARECQQRKELLRFVHILVTLARRDQASQPTSPQLGR